MRRKSFFTVIVLALALFGLCIIFSGCGCSTETEPSTEPSTESTEPTEPITKPITETTTSAASDYILIKTEMFNVKLPASWEGHYYTNLEPNENGLYYLIIGNKESRDAGFSGILLSICVDDASFDYSDELDYHVLGTINADSGSYIIATCHPTGVEFPDSVQDLYDQMWDDLDWIESHIEGANGHTIVR